MSSNNDLHAVTIPITTSGTIAVGSTNYYAFHTPTAANGGGVTITSAYVTEFSTAHAAGSAPVYRLLRYSGGGTPAIAGTIAGTVACTSVGTPHAFTISTAFVDANQWVVVEYGGTAVSAVGINAFVTMNYMMGY